MAAVLVIGGAGFIGARVCQRLIERGVPAVAMDASPDRHRLAGLTPEPPLCVGDVGKIQDLLRVLKIYRDIDRIVNLAYVAGAAADDPFLALHVNARGMVNAFEAAWLQELARVVFVSSIAVYGASQSHFGERAITEDDYAPPATIGTYGATKLLNEHMARLYRAQHDMSIVALRGSIVYGHGRAQGLTTWADEMVSGPALGEVAHIPYRADQDCSLIYVDDLAEMLVRLVLAEDVRHDVYNSGGHTVSVRDLAERIKVEISDAQVTWDDGAPEAPYVSCVSGERFAREFGWSQSSLSEGIRAHAAFAREHVVASDEERGRHG